MEFSEVIILITSLGGASGLTAFLTWFSQNRKNRNDYSLDGRKLNLEEFKTLMENQRIENTYLREELRLCRMECQALREKIESLENWGINK